MIEKHSVCPNGHEQRFATDWTLFRVPHRSPLRYSEARAERPGLRGLRGRAAL
jgi:hypothetical protein